jgi:hypothetical protein
VRCIACGENMILLNVVHDRTMIVPGYERQTLQCSACGVSERRLIFKSRQSHPARATSSAPRDNNLAVPGWGEKTLEGFRQMQLMPLCVTCGKRMALVEAVPNNSMMVSGYEHQTLRCSPCGVSERRFMFNSRRQSSG